jgi:hypothetical protein
MLIRMGTTNSMKRPMSFPPSMSSLPICSSPELGSSFDRGVINVN